MSRTYLDRWRSLPLSPTRSAALLMAVGLAGVGVPLAAAGLFDSQPLNGNRFAVLAQPVGEDRWKLLVLEQVKARPFCWREREDGLVTPSLNSFDFSGICSRYLDSNGYSLRTGGKDMAASFRLRIEADRRGLSLFALDPQRGEPLLVARTTQNTRDRKAFVKFDLEPGWSLERRAYQGRALKHVYFAHSEPATELIARARRRTTVGLFRGMPFAAPPPPPPLQLASSATGKGPIRLEVIPFRP